MKGLIDLSQRQSYGKVTRNRFKARVKLRIKRETEAKLHFISVVPKPRRKTESDCIYL
jgi:hypothetical protein